VIWYALKVMRQKEFVAERFLCEQGFNARVMVIHSARRVVRNARRRVLAACPHFPGWVFVGFDEGMTATAWAKLRAYKYLVKGVLATPEGNLVPISDKIMERIVLDFHQKPVLLTRQTRKRYRNGILAEIISGPYQGRCVRIVPVPPTTIELKDGTREPYHKLPLLVEIFTAPKAA
jgi:transcription antitermination factor NusG